MKLGNGLHSRTPVWIWLVMLIVGAVTLPGAAFVLAQETQATANSNSEAEATTAPTSTAIETSTHDVSDLLNLIRESKTVEQSAEAILMQEFPAPLPHLTRSTHDAETWKDVKLSIDNDRLTVVGSERSQQLIEEHVAYFREFGFEQITLTTRFISVAPTEFKELGVTWAIVNSEIEKPQPQSSESDHYSDKSDVSLASATERLDRKKPIRAESYVTTSATVLHALLDEQQTGSVVRTVQQSPTSSILQAPKVTFFNGQQATITNQSSQEFVINVEWVPEADGKPATYRPVTRTFKSGTALDMKVTKKGELIELDCEIEITSIRSVASTEVQIAAEEPAVTIQSPEIATVRISTANQIPVGKTLALCTTRSSTKGESEQLVVLLTCRVITPEWGFDKAATADATQQVLQATYAPVTVSRPAEKIIYVIRSTNKTIPSAEKASKRDIELMGVRFQIEGNVHCEFDETEVVFQGKNLCIQVDNEFELSGDEGEFKLWTLPGGTEPVSSECRFSGNVLVNLGELLHGSADELVLVSSDDAEKPSSVIAHGSVNFQVTDEEAGSSFSVAADEVSVSADMIATLKGNVRYSGKEFPGSLSANQLEWNVLTNEVRQPDVQATKDTPSK